MTALLPSPLRGPAAPVLLIALILRLLSTCVAARRGVQHPRRPRSRLRPHDRGSFVRHAHPLALSMAAVALTAPPAWAGAAATDDAPDDGSFLPPAAEPAAGAPDRVPEEEGRPPVAAAEPVVPQAPPPSAPASPAASPAPIAAPDASPAPQTSAGAATPLPAEESEDPAGAGAPAADGLANLPEQVPQSTPAEDPGPSPVASPPIPPEPPPADAQPRSPGGASVTVQPGDCLWSLSATRLGAEATDAEIDRDWRRVYAANKEVIGPDPNLIFPGQQLTIPPLS